MRPRFTHSLTSRKTHRIGWRIAINRGFYSYSLMEVDSFLADIQGEERIKKLMERVKYEWEHFEV